MPDSRVPSQGGPIRSFGVGLIALAALAAAGLFIRRRRPLVVAGGAGGIAVDDLYRAGL